jgi:hypothetical protein
MLITATGSPKIYYQWYSNSTNSNSGGTIITGATAASYSTPTDLAVGTTYYYYCEVSNNCGGTPVVSEVFSVTVNSISTLTAGSGSLSGKICFDINKSNFVGDCGTEESRASDAVDFSTLGAVQYTFTSTGTVSNVRYLIIDEDDCVTSAKSGTITMSGNTGTIDVTYKTTLSETGDIIYGRTRDNAAQVKIYVVYNNGTQDVQINLTAKIQDCICCPGLLIPGGEYNDIAMTTSLPSGSTTVNTDGSAIEALRSTFTSTGKDLCYYYRDYSSTANTNGSSTISWNNATNSGADMSYVCGKSNGNGVDAVHSSSAWRLPVLFELAQISELLSNNREGPNTTLTQAMVDAAMSYINGRLPGGSAVTAPAMYNLRRDAYLSSTQFNGSYAWSWNLTDAARIADTKSKQYAYFVRCVRSY